MSNSFVDTRPVIPLTNAQLLTGAARLFIRPTIYLTSALLPAMLLNANGTNIALANEYKAGANHGAGWIISLGWLVFGISAGAFGAFIDRKPSIIRKTRLIRVVASTLLLLGGMLAATYKVMPAAYTLVAMQIPAAMLCILPTVELTRAKKKTGRGAVSGLFAIALGLSYFIALNVSSNNTFPNSIRASVFVSLILIGVAEIVRWWFKRHPDGPVKHRRSKREKGIEFNHLIRFIIASVIFLACSSALEYIYPPLVEANVTTKGQTYDQVLNVSLFLLSLLSIVAVAGTVFFLFDARRVERTFVVGTLMFGTITLMMIGFTKTMVFIILSSLAGIGIGITSTTLLVLIMTYIPKKTWRGRAVGILFASIALGHALGPIVSHILIINTSKGFTNTLMVLALASCAVSGIIHVTRAKPNDFHVTF